MGSIISYFYENSHGRSSNQLLITQETTEQSTNRITNEAQKIKIPIEYAYYLMTQSANF